jgi:hypothetical protein
MSAVAPAGADGGLAEAAATGETVVLLHGQGRTRASLWLLGERLKSAGYKTLNLGYSGTRNSLAAITKNLKSEIAASVDTPVYHLVGHSLGNIIIRNGFKRGYPPGLGRIVMLAPPNRPAEMAQALRHFKLYQLLTGEAGEKLADEEFYRTLPVPTVPFAVIAGDKSHTGVLEEPNDGVITVASTKLPGMADWTQVHHTHTFLMNSGDTFQLVLRFLQTGSFGKRTD